MVSQKLFFTEVEHEGDLMAYEDEVRDYGITVTGRGMGSPDGEPDCDVGWLRIEYPEDGFRSVVETLCLCLCYEFIVGLGA